MISMKSGRTFCLIGLLKWGFCSTAWEKWDAQKKWTTRRSGSEVEEILLSLIDSLGDADSFDDHHQDAHAVLLMLNSPGRT